MKLLSSPAVARSTLGLGLALSCVGTASAAVQLPGSTKAPMIVPAADNTLWTSVALISAGDTAPNGYRLVGIPDGMGAYDNGDGTFSLLVNHELGNNAGIVRAHGGRGAFVSKWKIRKSDLAVLEGEDLIKQVRTWDAATASWVPVTGTALNFGRFCSADLPDVSALYNPTTGRGTRSRLFLNGEETGIEGRGMAHVVTGPDAGVSYDVPAIGKFSWENSLACPFPQDKTIVVGTDDGTGGQVYIYIGNKRSSGNEVEKAGLVGGRLYGVRLASIPTIEPTRALARGERSGGFSLVDLGDVTTKSGAELEAMSNAASVTSFQRPEDGHWNPSAPNEFYFLTTASFTTPSRLWVLRFADIANPEAGGTFEMLWDGHHDGDGSIRMMDNMTVNRTGQVIVQEDPGNQSYLARIHTYDIAKRTMRPVLVHSESFFRTGAPNFLTQDEETSGIIEVADILGTPDTYLINVQAHTAARTATAEVVEEGQILLLAPSTRQTNISSRARVAANEPMIAGFVISGTESKTVLVRALGPTLGTLGVEGSLNNPRLQLFKDGQPVAENNDWRFNQNSTAITATGLAPTSNNEAAMLLTLAPGSYTAIVRDEQGASGVALVDVFEFDTKPGHTAARVVNLSTRASVGSSGEVLIGGFSVAGNESKRVLIRALGPTLGTFGVANTLGDTQISVFRGSATVGSNDDWAADATTAGVLNSLTSLRPGNATESALVLTLEPGVYTVVVRGANNATGSALLDVTEI